MAFGPIMTVGATVAFGPRGLLDSLLASLILGFLAAAISFTRYFPNEVEDRAKGKRTPVTILGTQRATSVLVALWWSPISLALLWYSQDPRLLAALLPLPVLLVASAVMSGSRSYPRSLSVAIGLTVVAHLLAGLGLIIALLS